MADLVVAHCLWMMMLAMGVDYHFAMMNQRCSDTSSSGSVGAVATVAFQMNQSLNCSPHHIA